MAVNIVGSLFYGSLLGCFVLAFGFKRVGGTATFIGMLAGEVAIFSAFLFTEYLLALVQRDRVWRGGGDGAGDYLFGAAGGCACLTACR